MSICAFYMQEKNLNVIGKRVFVHSFNAPFYIKFRVGFTTAKYKNSKISLCETSNAFIYPFY